MSLLEGGLLNSPWFSFRQSIQDLCLLWTERCLEAACGAASQPVLPRNVGEVPFLLLLRGSLSKEELTLEGESGRCLRLKQKRQCVRFWLGSRILGPAPRGLCWCG